jgi:opacity protein-like surface antigen
LSARTAPNNSQNRFGQTQISASPYVGAGVSVSTADDSNVGFLLSGGLDVPVADQLTANAAVNVSFLDDTNVGLLLGVGYNF